MRAWITTVLTVATLAACGGGGGDDGVQVTVDANHTPSIDAMGANNNPAATKLGKVCTDPNACPAEAPQCVALSMSATRGWCANSCGTSTDGMTPPENGDMACASNYDGEDGTPLCVIHDAGTGGTFTWICAVTCGTIMNGGQTADLGECPGGLDCSENLCQ